MYALRTGVACSLSSCALVVACMVYFSYGEPDGLMHWGPSNAVRFAGIRIDSWGRWALVMAYSLGSQLAYTTVKNTLSPYVSNVIRDHKTPRDQKGTYAGAQAVVLCYTLFNWLISVFDVFLWVTMQAQFLIPAVAADAVMSVYYTHGYMTTAPVTRPLIESVF